jgi:hypothetical protein
VVGDRRLAERREQLKARWDRLGTRLGDTGRRADKINSEIRRARITLTGRHGTEFPDLD